MCFARCKQKFLRKVRIGICKLKFLIKKSELRDTNSKLLEKKSEIRYVISKFRENTSELQDVNSNFFKKGRILRCKLKNLREKSELRDVNSKFWWQKVWIVRERSQNCAIEVASFHKGLTFEKEMFRWQRITFKIIILMDISPHNTTYYVSKNPYRTCNVPLLYYFSSAFLLFHPAVLPAFHPRSLFLLFLLLICGALVLFKGPLWAGIVLFLLSTGRLIPLVAVWQC